MPHSILPLAVTMGVVGMYLIALLVLSSCARPIIGQKTWRALHYSSFLAWLSALGHSIFAGTDAGVAWVFFLYLGTGAAVAFMVAYRVIAPPLPVPGAASLQTRTGEGS